MTRRITAIIILLLTVVVSTSTSQWKSRTGANLSIVTQTTNADTLSTADQGVAAAYVDSLAWKAARIVVEVLNQYGSNAGSFTRKNWGAVHIHDGDDGTDHGCGLSIRMIGDGTFGEHIISQGDHSSALKIALEGDHPNHRGINLIMSPDGTSDSEVGLLIRNPSDQGIPIDIGSGSDAPAIYINFEDISSTKLPKAMIQVVADSTAATPGDFVNLGLRLEGTSFAGVADRYITMVDYNSSNYWGFRIDPTTDQLLFYYNNVKTAGIGTNGAYTDYVP